MARAGGMRPAAPKSCGMALATPMPATTSPTRATTALPTTRKAAIAPAVRSMPHWMSRMEPTRSLTQSPPMRPTKSPSEKAAYAKAATSPEVPMPWRR